MNYNVKIPTKCSVSTIFCSRMNSHCDVRDAVAADRMISYYYDHYQDSVLECEDVQSGVAATCCLHVFSWIYAKFLSARIVLILVEFCRGMTDAGS